MTCSISQVLMLSLLLPCAATASEELLSTRSTPGVRGGQLVVAQRSQPKTLNPVTALDSSSRDVIRRMHADLVHIDRISQQTVPALAKYWTRSTDGREYTIRLRRGVRFSDGHPFDADDVLFSFGVYLDPKVQSPQRDLLLVDGTPPHVEKLDRSQSGSHSRSRMLQRNGCSTVWPCFRAICSNNPTGTASSLRPG